MINFVVRIGNDKCSWLETANETTPMGHMTRKTITDETISPHLRSQELELSNSSPSIQYKHNAVFFELNWSNDELSNSNNTEEKFLSAFCQIRKIVSSMSSGVRMVVQDAGGGISGAAVFVALYQLLQTVDEAILLHSKHGSESADVKIPTLNIYKTVDDLRKNRGRMISTFAEYQYLFRCVKKYMQKRSFFNGIDVPNN